MTSIIYTSVIIHDRLTSTALHHGRGEMLLEAINDVIILPLLFAVALLCLFAVLSRVNG